MKCSSLVSAGILLFLAAIHAEANEVCDLSTNTSAIQPTTSNVLPSPTSKYYKDRVPPYTTYFQVGTTGTTGRMLILSAVEDSTGRSCVWQKSVTGPYNYTYDVYILNRTPNLPLTVTAYITQPLSGAPWSSPAKVTRTQAN